MSTTTSPSGALPIDCRSEERLQRPDDRRGGGDGEVKADDVPPPNKRLRRYRRISEDEGDETDSVLSRVTGMLGKQSLCAHRNVVLGRRREEQQRGGDGADDEEEEKHDDAAAAIVTNNKDETAGLGDLHDFFAELKHRGRRHQQY